jgi:hypothetical protein
MGGPYRKKKYHFGDTHLKKGWRVKRRTKVLEAYSKEFYAKTSLEKIK